MNPFSLLSKGETVKGLKNRHVSYKMLGNNALPNFTRPKEAFTAAPQPEAAADARPMPGPTGEKSSEALTGGTGPTGLTGQTGKTGLTGLTGGMPAPKEEKPSKAGFWSGLWRIAARRIGKCLPKGKAASSLPSVQTELALAKVTVIRNDLNDDDLEVVVGKKAGKKTEKPAQSEEVEREKVTPKP